MIHELNKTIERNFTYPFCNELYFDYNELSVILNEIAKMRNINNSCFYNFHFSQDDFFKKNQSLQNGKRNFQLLVMLL